MSILKSWFDLGADDPPDVPQIHYTHLRPLLDDLDVLLWVGKGEFSDLIRWGTGSWSSHVSTVKIAGAGPTRLVLNFESTSLNRTVRDHYSRTVRSGSQTNALSERLANNRGRVFCRRLVGPRTEETRVLYEAARRETSGLRYERNVWEMVRAATFLPDRENRKSVFCSELSAFGMKRAGVLNLDRPSNAYVPEDFEPGGGIERDLNPGWAFIDLVEVLY